MAKQEFWQYTKKTLFWLTYSALMGVNLFTLYFLGSSLYYEIFDPVSWRDNFTMYPYVEVEIPTSLAQKLEYLKAFIPIIVVTIWGNYRLYRKKKGGLWILAFLVWLGIFWAIVDFVFHTGFWD
ncbi:MAG: hypothetical protein NC218_10150 [Acetobacter sp.]|nr:hypothetical protein [Acetobacter sp.]